MTNTDRNSIKQVDLFTPIRLGPNELSNRFVMAPMTRNRAGAGDVPTAINAEYYAQRASAGLIITEASQVSPQGKGYPGTPGIYSNEQVQGWKRITDAVHAHGGNIFLQLWHVGRISHPTLQENGATPVAPSAIRPAGETFTGKGMEAFVTPRALETGEIPGIVEAYRKGAENALAAGFDGVEIHAANGYLIDQFLRDGTNRRTDGYGGSVEDRLTFLIEVVDAVRAVFPENRVGVRLSPTGGFNGMSDSDPAALLAAAADALSERRIGYLHLVDAVSGPMAGPLKLAPLARERFRGALILNGGFDRDAGNAAIAEGRADLVSFGVPFLANPDLPRRFAEGAPLNAPDFSTFYVGGPKGYVDYPALG